MALGAERYPIAMKSNSSQMVLVDSDAFIAWLVADDLLHKEAVDVLRTLQETKQVTVTTSLVVAETATVLSNRVGQEQAGAFLDFVEKLPIIHITEELQAEALKLFRQQATKGTSVVDCCNVAVVNSFHIAAIFSFDGFYRKHGLKIAG